MLLTLFASVLPERGVRQVGEFGRDCAILFGTEIVRVESGPNGETWVSVKFHNECLPSMRLSAVYQYTAFIVHWPVATAASCHITPDNVLSLRTNNTSCMRKLRVSNGNRMDTVLRTGPFLTCCIKLIRLRLHIAKAKSRRARNR